MININPNEVKNKINAENEDDDDEDDEDFNESVKYLNKITLFIRHTTHINFIPYY